MKFNLTLESDNLEEDIDKIVKTFSKAISEDGNKKLREMIVVLIKRADMLEGRLDSIQGVKTTKISDK